MKYYEAIGMSKRSQAKAASQTSNNTKFEAVCISVDASGDHDVPRLLGIKYFDTEEEVFTWFNSQALDWDINGQERHEESWKLDPDSLDEEKQIKRITPDHLVANTADFTETFICSYHAA